MKKTLAETLRDLRKNAGFTQKQVYEKLHIPQSTFSSWEIGKSEPSADMLLQLCKIYGVDDVLLAFGYDGYDEDGFLKPTYPELEMIEKYRSIDDFGRETVDLVLLREVSRVENQKNEKRIKIPTGTLVDFHEIKDIDDTEPCKLRPVKTTMQSLSAGCGSIGDDDQYTEINYPDEKVPDGTDFASKITGDSMEPTFFDGDIVFYELTQELREGDIGVFKKNDENFIKEYRKNGLVSHNPAYEIIVPGMDDHIETIGKVLGKL